MVLRAAVFDRRPTLRRSGLVQTLAGLVHGLRMTLGPGYDVDRVLPTSPMGSGVDFAPMHSSCWRTRGFSSGAFDTSRLRSLSLSRLARFSATRTLQLARRLGKDAGQPDRRISGCGQRFHPCLSGLRDVATLGRAALTVSLSTGRQPGGRTTAAEGAGGCGCTTSPAGTWPPLQEGESGRVLRRLIAPDRRNSRSSRSCASFFPRHPARHTRQIVVGPGDDRPGEQICAWSAPRAGRLIWRFALPSQTTTL